MTDDIAVNDFVRYKNQHMTHIVTRIAERVYYLKSGNYGRQSWAYREDIVLFQKYETKEAAA